MGEWSHMFHQFGLLSKDSVLNLPNAAYGVLFYLSAFMVPVLTFIPRGFRQIAMFGAATLAVSSSYFLGYVLMYKLGDICVVCISTYFVNTAIFILAGRDVLYPSTSGKITKEA